MRSTPTLSDSDLKMFVRPVSWRFLELIVPKRGSHWWREAVMEADEHGRGLLAWCKKTRRWSLSDKGRERLGLPKEETLDEVRSIEALLPPG